MKAFLLAAGEGTRLRPLTDSVPKCLLPIGGVPLLRIWLETCRRHGINEVLLNVHSHAGAVKVFVRDCDLDLKITVFEEPVLLGSAGTVRANREWVREEAEFWVLYADVLTAADLSAVLAFHRSSGALATLGVYRVPEPKRCGIVGLDQRGIVREFVEKPEHPNGNLAFSGILVGTPAVLDFLPEHVPADIGHHLLPRLVGRMAATPIPEYLTDIGTLANYQKAQEEWPGVCPRA